MSPKEYDWTRAVLPALKIDVIAVLEGAFLGDVIQHVYIYMYIELQPHWLQMPHIHNILRSKMTTSKSYAQRTERPGDAFRPSAQQWFAGELRAEPQKSSCDQFCQSNASKPPNGG